jgi:hypothetical protein
LFRENDNTYPLLYNGKINTRKNTDALLVIIARELDSVLIHKASQGNDKIVNGQWGMGNYLAGWVAAIGCCCVTHLYVRFVGRQGIGSRQSGVGKRET